jgi:Fe-S cluster assembly protein SufD
MNAVVADRFLTDFERLRAALPGSWVPWLQRAREDAFNAFLDKGFPTTRDEEWKYTSVAAIEQSRFMPVLTPAAACSDLGCVGVQALPGARLMVFVDGRHAPELSRMGTLPAGITISSVASMIERNPERLQSLMSAPPEGYKSGLSALNAAFAADGAYVHLAAGADLEEPLHLLFLGATPRTAAHVRNMVVACAGSRVRIVEHHAAVDAETYLTNTLTDITVERGAAVEHHKLQDEADEAFHVAGVLARIGEEAHFHSTSVALGSALARVGIEARLTGPGAHCNLDGLTLADGHQHIDHHTVIDHMLPGGTSREFYKGVLDGASRAIFNGRIVVRPGAQKSDAEQSNRNLLLSAQAEADSKPQLEIWADDVKCAHGATVGQLDPDQIFYLQSRGVDAESARAMLVLAFAREIVDRVAVPALRQRLNSLLRARLPQVAGAMQ